MHILLPAGNFFFFFIQICSLRQQCGIYHILQAKFFISLNFFYFFLVLVRVHTVLSAGEKFNLFIFFLMSTRCMHSHSQAKFFIFLVPHLFLFFPHANKVAYHTICRYNFQFSSFLIFFSSCMSIRLPIILFAGIFSLNFQLFQSTHLNYGGFLKNFENNLTSASLSSVPNDRRGMAKIWYGRVSTQNQKISHNWKISQIEPFGLSSLHSNRHLTDYDLNSKGHNKVNG